jgi:hypothetical protein
MCAEVVRVKGVVLERGWGRGAPDAGFPASSGSIGGDVEKAAVEVPSEVNGGRGNIST